MNGVGNRSVRPSLPSQADRKYNLFEQSFSKRLIETSTFIEEQSLHEETKEAVESLSRLSPSILMGPVTANYSMMQERPVLLHNDMFISIDSPGVYSDVNTVLGQHTSPITPASDTPDKRKVAQERNRRAAVRSRLKKKQEWSRLIEIETQLRAENDALRNRVHYLETAVLELQHLLGERNAEHR